MTQTVHYVRLGRLNNTRLHRMLARSRYTEGMRKMFTEGYDRGIKIADVEKK